MPKILLMGYFGAGNFGDDALLVDWLLRRQGWLEANELQVDVISRGQGLLSGFVEGENLGLLINAEIDKQKALKLNPRDYAALIAPGGSLLQDSTSVRSLVYYLLLLRRFHSAKVPTYMLNQGLGPLSSWVAAFFTPRQLSSCRMLSLRDRVSHNMCLRSPYLSALKGLVHSADPIINASFSPPGTAHQWQAPHNPYALVIPRPTGDLPTAVEPLSEAQALGRLLNHCVEVTGLDLVLLPLHQAQDKDFCEEVSTQLDKPASVISFQEGAPMTGSQAWSIISSASLVISYRLHGLVAAAACGIVSMGIAYDPKISSLCNELGLPYCFPATVHATDSLDDLRRMWNSKGSVAEYMNIEREKMINRLSCAEARFDKLWG